MNKSDLRPLVFAALRQEPRTHFVNVEARIRDLTPEYQPHDALKVRETLWELLIQGILAPGMNYANLDFPWIHVTDYGVRCLEANDILPHDPNRYTATPRASRATVG